MKKVTTTILTEEEVKKAVKYFLDAADNASVAFSGEGEAYCTCSEITLVEEEED
jgi:hypothetical protein